MSIKKIPNVSCSLNLGLIYNLSYSYIPQEGSKISILFFNENGIYNTSNILSPSSKTNIQIGNASFNLYPIKYELLQSVERKILKVDFIDETFKLDNYMIAIRGRGCGQNVFQLGSPINNNLDKNFQYPDIEYYFVEFIRILKQKFPVEISANYDNSVPRAFAGTFREVLDEWCSFYNFSYFFENSVLKIIDRATLSINFPTKEQLPFALNFNVSESIENTYDTTAFSYLLREGNQSDVEGNIKYVDLYPVDYGSNIGNGINLVFGDLANQIQNIYNDFENKKLNNPNSQSQYSPLNIDMKQVCAAMYGREFWFLYNYYNGTLQTECGWTSISKSQLPTITVYDKIMGPEGLGNDPNGVKKLGLLNQDIFDKKYEMYKSYGERIAGRYYISSERTDVDDSEYQWYDNTNQNTNFNEGLQIDVQHVTQGNTNSVVAYIDGTYINEYFQGIQYVGNHIVYVDKTNSDFVDAFSLTPTQDQNIKRFYDNIVKGLFGSDRLDYTPLGTSQYVIYEDQMLNDDLVQIFNQIDSKKSAFLPKYNPYGIKGISKRKVQSIVNVGNQYSAKFISPNLITMQPVINPINSISYPIQEICNSFSSNGDTYKRHFTNYSISTDVPSDVRLIRVNDKIFSLTRDLTIINNYFSSNILRYLAQQNLIPLKTVTFSLNYFYDVPNAFVSNGLTNMNLDVSENGISATYTFSNSMVQKIKSEEFIAKLERSIRNSWIRHYNPNGSITI